MDDLAKKYPRIYLRYRKAKTEGQVIHDGDCDIYNAHLEICTCGLHHDLLPLPSEDTNQIYPNFYEEMAGKGFVETLLMCKHDGGIFVKCGDCQGEGGVGMVKCENCGGKGLEEFKITPVSEEEMEKIMNEFFTRKDEDDD